MSRIIMLNASFKASARALSWWAAAALCSAVAALDCVTTPRD
jgi:hypothetical protein